MKRNGQCFLIIVLMTFISSCIKSHTIKLPPVMEGWYKAAALKNNYIVQKGDTVYSIAWNFGVDYRYLAYINNIKPPYVLRCGDGIRIADLSKVVIKEQAKYQTNFKPGITCANNLYGWRWPTSGKIVSTFNNKLGGNNGIDIVGNTSQKIHACNSGTVVYSGSGLRSYGKLIIIKHSDDYLSAYAYNRNILVNEGEQIKGGQKIATMGKNNDGRAALHFEIRCFGRPINPLLYLPKRKHEYQSS